MELVGESASADFVAAESFPDELRKLIMDKWYLLEQVFDADETDLFWKRMPSRTYLAKSEKSAPGFKAAKNRLTLLFCVNASGYMIKPMVVYISLNPRALKGKNKEHLPVYWKANKKVWVTASLFSEWFRNCFLCEVELYLASKSLPFKVLLTDNAPGHPENLMFDHSNVEILFLPPNTSSLLQPLDQGVTEAFKTYFIRRTFISLLNEMVKESNLTISQS
jgi:hypothetical protein